MEGSFNLKDFQEQLQMLDKMGSGALSQHNASMIVGQRLVDKFIKPQLNGTSGGK